MLRAEFELSDLEDETLPGVWGTVTGDTGPLSPGLARGIGTCRVAFDVLALNSLAKLGMEIRCVTIAFGFGRLVKER
jgi:hypothetical protein